MTRERSLTRRELYDLVWSRPMTKLASEFGVSDVALKKTCDRYRVPTPPRGYWAKLEAGQKPKRALFVEVSDVRLNRIQIGYGVIELPEAVRETIEARKAERKAAMPIKQKSDPIQGWAFVEDVHFSIRKTAELLRSCEPQASMAVAEGTGACGVSIGRKNIERSIFVLDQLARQLEQSALPLSPTGQAIQVLRGADTATMHLREKTRTIDHVPTVEELAEEAKRKEQLEKHWRNPSRWHRPPYGQVYPEKDTVWTGELSIQKDTVMASAERGLTDVRSASKISFPALLMVSTSCLQHVNQHGSNERNGPDNSRNFSGDGNLLAPGESARQQDVRFSMS